MEWTDEKINKLFSASETGDAKLLWFPAPVDRHLNPMPETGPCIMGIKLFGNYIVTMVQFTYMDLATIHVQVQAKHRFQLLIQRRQQLPILMNC
jgi:hypothetical protein